MSRTPKYNLNKLPLWVQNIIEGNQEKIASLQVELESMEESIKTLEEINVDLARRVLRQQQVEGQIEGTTLGTVDI